MKSTKTKNEVKKTYYSYIRVSTKEQAKKGKNGLQRQMEKIDDYCAEHDIDDITHFSDLGKSAYHGHHLKKGSGLHTFVQSLYAGELGENPVLLVESLDRLSRQEPFDAQLQLMTYMSHGLEIVTLMDGQVYSKTGDTSKLTVALVVSLTKSIAAHEESDKRSDRQKDNIKKGRERARKDKTPTIGCPPAWIRPVKKIVEGKQKTVAFELIPERAKLIKEICELVESGISKSGVTRLLNERQEPTFGRGKKIGVRWHVSYVQQICTNPALIGELHPYYRQNNGKKYQRGEDVIKGYYPRIISNETFNTISATKTRYAKVVEESETIRTIGLNIFHHGIKMRFVGKGRDKRYKNSKFNAYYQTFTRDTKKLIFSIYYDKLEPVIFESIQQHNPTKQKEKNALFKVERQDISSQRIKVQLLETQLSNLLGFIESGELEQGEMIVEKINNLQLEFKEEKQKLDKLIKGSNRKNYSTTTIEKTLKNIRGKEFSRKLLQEVSAKIVEKIDLQENGLIIHLSDQTVINTTKIQ